MESIKYVNLIEIGLVVIEIQGVENGQIVVSANNTLVCHTAFLGAHHYFWYENSSKLYTSDKSIVFVKSFKAAASVI